jgi:hypothetical protein
VPAQIGLGQALVSLVERPRLSVAMFQAWLAARWIIDFKTEKEISYQVGMGNIVSYLES